jgi:hypothetical protein
MDPIEQAFVHGVIRAFRRAAVAAAEKHDDACAVVNDKFGGTVTIESPEAILHGRNEALWRACAQDIARLFLPKAPPLSPVPAGPNDQLPMDGGATVEQESVSA